MNYFTCSNQKPSLDSLPSKSKFGYFEIASFILNVCIMFRINFNQKKNNVQTENCISKKKQFLLQLEKQSLTDFTTASLSIFAFIINSVLASKINSLNVKEINQYPNYVYMYFFQLVEPCLISSLISLLYYCRHPPLRESMFREFKNNFPCYKWKEINKGCSLSFLTYPAFVLKKKKCFYLSCLKTRLWAFTRFYSVFQKYLH